MTNANSVTTRLNVASDILKLEAKLRDIGPGRTTSDDRAAVAALQGARERLLSQTDRA